MSRLSMPGRRGVVGKAQPVAADAGTLQRLADFHVRMSGADIETRSGHGHDLLSVGSRTAPQAVTTNGRIEARHDGLADAPLRVELESVEALPPTGATLFTLTG